MGNEGKKRKLLQRRKANDHSKLEASAVIEGLAEQLHKESEQTQRLFFLAQKSLQKYYLKRKTHRFVTSGKRRKGTPVGLSIWDGNKGNSEVELFLFF